MDRIQTTIPAIGAAIEGGFFAGLIRISDKTYGLVVAPKESGEMHGPWGDNNDTPNANSFCDGLSNTEAMREAGSEIAVWARSLDIDGKADWYIPSRDELELCYRNLKPTTNENYCWRGDNPSSIPTGYAYQPNLPSQTPTQAFQDGGAEAFDPRWHWSSTQSAGGGAYAWGQYFDDGGQGSLDKDYEGRVRAVRRFLIP